MISEWTHHIKEADKKDQYQKSLIHSKWILEDLDKILTRMGTSLERQERSPQAYDCVNWAERQAHTNGFLQCLHKIKFLINLDQKETNNDQSIRAGGQQPTSN